MRVKDKNNHPTEQKVVGSHLKHLREEQGLSYEEVSTETKISVSNLKAMEAHDFANLPADTFTRGLLTLYGNFLGIDGQLAANRFIKERNNGKKPDRFNKTLMSGHSLAPKKLAEPSHIPSATVAAFLLALIALTFTGFCLYTSWNPFAFFTNTTKDITSTIMAAFDDSPPSVIETIEGDQILLKAHFLDNASVEVSIDDQPTVHQEFIKNKKTEWRASSRLLLRFSEPASAKLTLNGKPFPFDDAHSGEFQLQLKKGLEK
ncbi:helix-turn-helix transcriptional regulator [Desulfogranum marinum]|uniref:helix-turn-helix domain-containing protein n=1 Tax=Desulfogranum marinum TaxID=453220 RepID=UPI0029C94BC7|nr:helix-turn-helix transcriptional regulator [Desulfogranum marinum]